jgi:hypothetical protein
MTSASRSTYRPISHDAAQGGHSPPALPFAPAALRGTTPIATGFSPKPERSRAPSSKAKTPPPDGNITYDQVLVAWPFVVGAAALVSMAGAQVAPPLYSVLRKTANSTWGWLQGPWGGEPVTTPDVGSPVGGRVYGQLRAPRLGNPRNRRLPPIPEIT